MLLDMLEGRQKGNMRAMPGSNGIPDFVYNSTICWHSEHSCSTRSGAKTRRSPLKPAGGRAGSWRDPPRAGVRRAGGGGDGGTREGGDCLRRPPRGAVPPVTKSAESGSPDFS